MALLVFSLLLALVVLEGGLRLALPSGLHVRTDERSLSYRHDPTLGWFPEAGSDREIEGSRVFRALHNSRGFRDRETGPKSKPRLLVLGDSYVWGFDVEAEERFTARLQEQMPEWEVLNLGVSGYGTDQALLLLEREIGFYDPDLVFLVFTEQNDRDDNRRNRSYEYYYKPWFESGAEGLALRGTPVPRSLPHLQREWPRLFESWLVRGIVHGTLTLLHPPREGPDPSEALVLAIRDRAHEHGAGFAFGVEGQNPEWPWADFVRKNRIHAVHLNTKHRYPGFGGHWTPEGHRVVSDRIASLLRRAGWLPADR